MLAIGQVANELYVPVGSPVQISLESVDVLRVPPAGTRPDPQSVRGGSVPTLVSSRFRHTLCMMPAMPPSRLSKPNGRDEPVSRDGVADLPPLAGLAVGGVRHSLVDIAYLALRDSITSGALLPGTRLREAALARHFSISVTPVREALRRLDREGLIRHSPNRGAVVAEFDLREILDLFEIREVLECRAARRAAVQPSRDVRGAESLIAAAAKQITQRDRVEWNRLEVAFHRAINDLSGNFELAELAERIHRNVQGLCVRCLREPIYGPEQLRLMQSHHQSILEAVRDGNAREAEARTRAHIRSIRDSIAAVLGSEGG
jgi:DNA-binding GntR family transcriptional regulator